MPNPLILDTDGGVDDAQALMMLLAAGRVPEAITTVFGNVDLETASANILGVLAAMGADVPVHYGARQALVEPVIEARHIHGENGLGGVARPAALAAPASRDGVAFLIQRLRRAVAEGAKVDLLMIGPLTNLALVLRAAPDCAEGIGQLTIMGATLNGRGNVTPAAEFNIYADPEAAQMVFSAELNTVIVPWETCMAHVIEGSEIEAHLAALAPHPQTEFATGLARHARRVVEGYTGQDCLRYVDHLAAAVVIAPEVVTRVQKASLGVALAQGVARGMVVVDPSGRLGTPEVTLVEEADLGKLHALFTATFAPLPASEAQ